MAENFQKILFREISIFLRPLISASTDLAAIRQLFGQIGWDLNEISGLNLAQLQSTINTFVTAYEQIASFIDNPPDNLEEFEAALDTTVNVLNTIRQIPNLIPEASRPSYFDQIGIELLEYLLVKYLNDHHSLLWSGAVLLSFACDVDEDTPIIPEVVDADTGKYLRYPHKRPRLRLNQIISLLRDPLRTLKTEYHINGGLVTPDDVHTTARKLFQRTSQVLQAIGVEAIYGFIPSQEYDLGVLGNEIARDMLTFRVNLDLVDGGQTSFGATLSLSPIDQGNLGLVVTPFGSLQITQKFASWAANISIAAAIDAFAIGENGFTLLASEDTTRLDISAAFTKLSEENGSAFLIGSSTGTRLQIGRFEIKGEGNFDDSQQSYGVQIDIGEAVMAISKGQGDSFLQKVLPKDSIETEFDFSVGWSSADGLYFRGSAALEVTIPIHKTLGPIKIESVYLEISVDGDINTTLAASAGAKIGPVAASIDRVGIKLPISFPSGGGGNLGPVQIDSPQFKPPTGVGLVIASEAVTGGGFLEFDHENKRYTGILQLEFKKIGLVAIGLITTRMPDGSKGFSMLLSICVTFDPAISLPYNFKLMGVGGLIGIHRSMIIEVIRQGLRNRTLDSIMFPEDPILNAAKIISDLRAVFPPTEDRFVLGPMAKLGWNSPPLITGDIGILIEIPQPVRIAIIGQLALVLPKKEKAIVTIHLDMIGVVDFDKCLFSFDASLYDSKILTFTLSGDSAMRLSWGEEPNFALSIGGLHPRFRPPPKFPTLRRLRLSIGSGNNPRINFDTYQAVTSNSTQFGAKLEVYAKKGKFSIQGYLGFDALFIFSPFSFVVEIGAGVSVKVGRTTLFSISLDLMLAGTSPWRAKGKATFKILFIKIKIRFDKSWGQRKKVSLPAVDPTEQLRAALQDPGNWAGILPAKSQMAVSLRKSEEKTDAIVVHPMGRLEIRQRVLPFGVKLEKFGNAPVTGPGTYTIDEVKTGTEDSGFTPLSLTPVKDHFARGQFEDISDAKKVSSPSFEKFIAGVRAGSDRIAFEHPVSYTLEYETEVIDENRVAHQLDPTTLPWRMGKYLMAGSAARLGAMRNAGSLKYTVFGKAAKVRMQEEAYVIAGMKDMKAEQGIPHNDTGMTYSQAKQAYDEYVRNNPEKQGSVQITLKQEVAA